MLNKPIISFLRAAAVAAAVIFPAVVQADTDGVVYRDKHHRFTVVADGLVRMEYAPDGRFVDSPSFVGFERSYPEVKAEVTDENGSVRIATPKLSLTYRKSKGPFTADNLTIKSAEGVKYFEWTPGTEQKENLLGTTRTLDQWDGSDIMLKGDDGKRHPHPRTLDKGLLARDGWTLIDDSRGFIFDTDPDIPWVKKRKTKRGAQDWYFLAYGDDYEGALRDFTILSGPMSLPPRYAFGYWWSRWWAYSEHEFKNLIRQFDDYDIPLEVLVIDMDWHYTDAEHGGWTGWTWNRRLFPEPERFLNYLRDHNKKVTLNLHPASGVKKFEASYPTIARENGIDPATEADVPWVSSDRRFINSVFDNILNPMSREGVSFWWLDWQQEPFDAKIDSLSNTWWLNYLFFNKMKKDQPDVRPMIYHRWGGLGNHRYQIGFSGDNYATWKSLDFLPYFTATAANVCYGFWCHDLGGHYMAQGDSTTNGELYARSMQFGAYSPMMRTHSNKNARLVKEPWNFDRKTLSVIRAAVQERYRMVPYIYTMARKAHDTGLAICRPLYYSNPEKEEAYSAKGEYMFGDCMLVAPVTHAGTDGFADMVVWLPEGLWYEKSSGTMLRGDSTYTRRFALDETPVYVKAGSVIPVHARRENTLRHNDNPICFEVYPGGDGSFTLYEDYGDDNLYDTEYATTEVRAARTDTTLNVTIAPRRGSYREMPSQRAFSIRVPATLPPLSVTVDGVPCDFTYDPTELAAVVELPLKPCDTGRSIEMTFPSGSTVDNGVIGDMKRFVSAFGDLKNHYARLCVNEEFGPMSTVYENIEYYPERTAETVSTFKSKFDRISEIIASQDMSDKARAWFLKAIGR